jgi:hypothetical protein
MLSPSRPQNRMTHQKCVLKEEINDTQHVVFDVAHNIEHNALCVSSTKMETGLVGIGVPIGTDAFVQNFVPKRCRAIIDDVEKLDAIQGDSIHYQLLWF